MMRSESGAVTLDIHFTLDWENYQSLLLQKTGHISVLNDQPLKPIIRHNGQKLRIFAVQRIITLYFGDDYKDKNTVAE